MKRNTMITLGCLALITVLSMASGHAAESVKRTSAAKSRAALLTEVNALHVEQVAWRKIAWKTCLLDGIRESRKQHKPMILWIFIDRPVNDERC